MTANPQIDRHPWAVFLIFLRLGLTSFGGPIAHLGYFRQEFVTRRQWLTERSYADLVALCQFLPGPASSQVGIALGLFRCGYAGAFAAWAGFTLPSAAALILLAMGLTHYSEAIPPGALHGLKVVAVAVVAQAVWGMARQLCPDTPRITLMVGTACAVLVAPSTWTQLAAMATAALIGLAYFKPQLTKAHDPLPVPIRPGVGLTWLTLFFALLIGLPLWASIWPHPTLLVVDAFYRAGALVFGGGHVVLPMLQTEVVSSGWVTGDVFLAGYGAAQAVPGPLFTFAAFLGASMEQAPSGAWGGVICLLSVFAPSFLLVAGVLPFWERLRQQSRAQGALGGLNAAVVVGLLLAALYHPTWTSSIHSPTDFGLAVVALLALMLWKWPPWAVVIGTAAAGWLVERLF